MGRKWPYWVSLICSLLSIGVACETYRRKRNRRNLLVTAALQGTAAVLSALLLCLPETEERD